MEHSLTYYLTLLVLKLKGVKKMFSQDPIDYEKLRKDDVRRPPHFEILQTSVTEVRRDTSPPGEKLLIFVHGGAYISGPAKHHWDSIEEIAKKTDFTIWMCDYPKAPETKISEISKNIDSVYDAALEKYQAEKITLIGDSAGASLVTALTQRLIEEGLTPPRQLILVSPVMDARMSNPEIGEVDRVDPMLSQVGVLSAKKMCAGNEDLGDVMISPLNGSFENFPPTVLFLAEHDITSPDQLLAAQKMGEAKVELEVIVGKGMPHIWPFLPVMKEAKLALRQLIDRLNHGDE